MILVIGGRSKIGSALIDDLVARGEQVRAMVRSGESADSFPAGVQTVLGDLAGRASLDAAMEGADKLFLLCGPTQDEVEFNQNAIDAAAAAGVSLVVRSSILGADPNSPATFVRDHGISDAALRDSGLPHAIVRPNMFMENVPENYVPSIDENGNFYANAGQARLSMVDTRDVAAVAAALLTESGDQEGIYDVTGPEALSYQDIAGKLSSRLGRQINFVDVPDDAVGQTLLGFGTGEWMAGALVDLFQAYKRSGTDGYAAAVTDTVQRITGRAPRSLDMMLEERVQA
jgi:uncharacterized protein YbjT (DUF2867 family)